MKHLKSYNIFENFDESEQWLREIFLELKDGDYNITLKNTKSNFHSSAAMCRTYNVTIDVWGLKRKSFKLSDVFEYILTSESYMKDDGWFLNNIRFRTESELKKNKNVDWFTLNREDINKLRDINNLRKEVHEITYLDIEFKMN